MSQRQQVEAGFKRAAESPPTRSANDRARTAAIPRAAREHLHHRHGGGGPPSCGRWLSRRKRERRRLVRFRLSRRDFDTAKEAGIVASPTGQQRFVLGRGNLQISPALLRRVGGGNVQVVATPTKLARTPLLRVDTGDALLDAEFTAKEYMFLLVGYRARRLHPIGGEGGGVDAD